MKENQKDNSVSQKKEIENNDLFFNKLTFFVLGGLITTPFLIYIIIRFRSVMFDSVLLPYDTIWVPIVVGIFVAYNIQKITYQPFDDGRVTGIPFPIILWEPLSEGSDYWLDFYDDNYSPISFFLNYVYFVLVSMAVTLVVCHIIPVRMNTTEILGYCVIAISVSYCLFLAYQSILSLIEYFLKKKRINKLKEKYPDGFSFDGNYYCVSTDNGCIPELDESDVESFISSGYSDSDVIHGLDNMDFSDFGGGFDVGG